MNNPTKTSLPPAIAAVLPVGELESGPLAEEYEQMLAALRSQGASLVLGEPVSNEDQARQALPGLLGRDPDLVVLVPLRGLSAPVMEAAARMCPAPVLFWPVRERYALPSSALAIGAIRETGLPAELLYGPADHPTAIERLRSFIQAARAYTRLRRSHLGVIGGLFPNLVACRYDPEVLRSRLGVTLHSIPFAEVREGIGAVSPVEMESFRRELEGTFAISDEDRNDLAPGCGLHLALKQLARGRQLDGFVTECWSGFPKELGLNPCLGFAKDAYPLACEGDAMLGALLLAIRYLAGVHVFVGDLYDLDLDGILTLVHCGAPAALGQEPGNTVLGKSRLAQERGFTTITCRPRLDPGPVTLLRLYGQNCDRIHLAAGELLDCEQTPNLKARIRIAGDRWDFLRECTGNHYAVVPGEIRGGLDLLCKWLQIKIVET